MMRQIVLDTETTGLNADDRIIEIGCIELVDRKPTGRFYHQLLFPGIERIGGTEIHGITETLLDNQPTFADIALDFVAFVGNDELVIHNAPFDLSFLDREMKMANINGLTYSSVVDTLTLARQMWPGKRNNLNALAERLGVDCWREVHGALLDAEILADVYLKMTGGQVAISLSERPQEAVSPFPVSQPRLVVIRPTPEEEAAHRRIMRGLL